MKCWNCETEEVKLVVIADDGYYAPKGVCADDVCIENACISQFSLVTVVSLDDCPADEKEYIEHAQACR